MIYLWYQFVFKYKIKVAPTSTSDRKSVIEIHTYVYLKYLYSALMKYIKYGVRMNDQYDQVVIWYIFDIYLYSNNIILPLHRSFQIEKVL